jgi:two-component system alkaline phosphatase synthesis response regulator PhoP
MAKRRKILAVDDEPHILELLAMNLGQNGYDSCLAPDGATALELAVRERPDLILLDLMLPGLSGLETCRLLRQDPRTARIPIIILSARSEESDKVIGLGIGADDYVTKPFGLRELMARIEVALRHAQPSPQPAGAERLRSGDLEIDEDSREVLRGGRRVVLSPTEYSLLALLAREAGKAMRREDIARELDLVGAGGDARSLDVHVRNLRRKLGTRADGADYVETIRGFGYRLHAQPE